MTVANQKGEFFFSRNLPVTTYTALLVVDLIFGVLMWGFFLWTGTRKDTNISKGPANLSKFQRRNRDKCCSKDFHFLCRKTLRNGIELRQDQYYSMRKLSNLSQSVAFWQSLLSVDVFFRRRRPMNNLELTTNSQVYLTNKCIMAFKFKESNYNWDTILHVNMQSQALKTKFCTWPFANEV